MSKVYQKPAITNKSTSHATCFVPKEGRPKPSSKNESLQKDK